LRGIAHKALGQFGEAMSDMRETLLRDPIHFGAIDTCGKLNLLIGNYAVVVEDFTRALALLPSDSIDSIDCLRLRGIALQSIARDAEAIEDFTRVIARLPDDASAYARRALSYDRLGKNQLARADFDRAKILVQAQ
jgi:tetratricopeptide (TPR) repeat protein